MPKGDRQLSAGVAIFPFKAVNDLVQRAFLLLEKGFISFKIAILKQIPSRNKTE